MTGERRFDVIVVGGGIAGAALAGVLVRSGLGVLLVEREARFRDRIRGEALLPWGVAEARRLGIERVLEGAGRTALREEHTYQDRRLLGTERWPADPQLGFSHPRLQEALLAWAGSLGATTLRPAKAVAMSVRNGLPRVTVARDGGAAEYTARLVVAADGKRSGARRWVGATTVADPERHWFGGVQLAGLRRPDDVINYFRAGRFGGSWHPTGPDTTRLYVRMSAALVGETGVGRAPEALVALVAPHLPEGALDDARVDGPFAFFADTDVWATRLASEHVALLGDAAGAPDPKQGHGTALAFRDVRELGELLLGERDWAIALAEYARRRARYFEVIRAYDLWRAILVTEDGVEADRRRERHARAKERDPSLGGFAEILTRGPDGLVPDEAARRHYFGEE